MFISIPLCTSASSLTAVEPINGAIAPGISRQPNPTDLIRPTVIGLYGAPGSGMTFFIDSLKHYLGDE